MTLLQDVIGVDVASGEPLIAGMAARSGRILDAGDAGEKVAALDFHFGREKGLPPTGTVKLAGGAELDYVGQVLTPEYFLVTTPSGGLLAESQYAALVAPLDTLQEITGNQDAVNDLVVRLTPEGRKVLARQRSVWQDFVRALERVAGIQHVPSSSA